jgi:hypothetical protein
MMPRKMGMMKKLWRKSRKYRLKRSMRKQGLK